MSTMPRDNLQNRANPYRHIVRSVNHLLPFALPLSLLLGIELIHPVLGVAQSIPDPLVLAQTPGDNFWQFNAQTHQLQLTLPPEATPRYFLLARPMRIAIDFPVSGSITPQDYRYTGAVERLTLASQEGGQVRLILYLKPGVELQPKQVALQQIDDQRWLITPLLVQPTSPAAQIILTPTEAQNPGSTLDTATVEQNAAALAAPPVNLSTPASIPDRSSALTQIVPTASLPPRSPLPQTEISPSPNPDFLPPSSEQGIPSAVPALPDQPTAPLPTQALTTQPLSTQPLVNHPTPPPIQTPAVPDRVESSRPNTSVPNDRSPVTLSTVPLTPISPEVSSPVDTIVTTPHHTTNNTTPIRPPLPVEFGQPSPVLPLNPTRTPVPPSSIPRAQDPIAAPRPTLVQEAADSPTTLPLPTIGFPQSEEQSPVIPPPQPNEPSPVTPPATQPRVPLPTVPFPTAPFPSEPQRSPVPASLPPFPVQSSPTGLVKDSPITLRYTGTTPLELSGDRVQEVLIVDEDVKSANGLVIIPAGSEVLGQFESNWRGSRFVAQAITLRNSPVNQNLGARSDRLDGDRSLSPVNLAIGSGVGAVAGTVIAGGFGALGGIALGAATGYFISPQAATIVPHQTLVIYLNEDWPNDPVD